MQIRGKKIPEHFFFMFMTKQFHFFSAVIFMGGILCFPLRAANLPPSVSAGQDQPNASTGAPVYLMGDANDNSTPFDSLIILWRQISGPLQADIRLPTSITTSVVFADSGVYQFELSVSDGDLTARDTVVVTVRKHLPFVLLRPADREPIEAGRPYTIRWQMDPSIPCTAWFTLDDGVSWIMLTELGSVTDSFVWNVPKDLQPGQEGRIWVHEYQNSSNTAAGSGTFIVMAPGQSVRGNLHTADFAPAQSVAKLCLIAVARAYNVSAADIFDASGRCFADKRTSQYCVGAQILRMQPQSDRRIE